MRIAQVSPLYESVPPKLYGGTERIVSYLTEELVSQGHDVTLFASGDSVTSSKLESTCPNALRLNDASYDHLAHHLVMLEQLFRRKEDFDIIHFHVDYLHFPFSRIHGVPNVTTLHGRLDIPDLVPLYREFAEMGVVSISDSQRMPLSWIKWYGTVHHGLPSELYQYGKGDGGYLAFLGRVSPEKGLEKAIEIAVKAGKKLRIAAKIDKKDADFFSEVIRPLLEHSLIEFIGEIGESEKNAFLGNAEALLFPIDWEEPFGLVMIESIACGTPVIAFPRGSVTEIIKEGVSGFLVRTVDEAVSVIKKLGSLSRIQCRRAFEERFTAARMAKDYVDIYKTVLASGEKTVKLVAKQGGKNAGSYSGGYTS